jgi:hypothetical protein
MTNVSTRSVRAFIAVSVLSVTGLLVSASLALASSYYPQDPYEYANAVGEAELSSAEGQVQCQPDPSYTPSTNTGDFRSWSFGPPPICRVTGQLSVSATVRRYLGLGSETFASGTFAGPQGPFTRNPVSNQSQQDLYDLKFPASFARAIKDKHVIGITIYLTGSATYEVFDCGHTASQTQCGITNADPAEHTQKLEKSQVSLTPPASDNGVGCPMFEGTLVTAVRAGPHRCPNP